MQGSHTQHTPQRLLAVQGWSAERAAGGGCRLLTHDVAPLAKVRLDQLLRALGRHVAAEEAGAAAARGHVGHVVSTAQAGAAIEVELLLQTLLQALQDLQGGGGRRRRQVRACTLPSSLLGLTLGLLFSTRGRLRALGVGRRARRRLPSSEGLRKREQRYKRPIADRRAGPGLSGNGLGLARRTGLQGSATCGAPWPAPTRPGLQRPR